MSEPAEVPCWANTPSLWFRYLKKLQRGSSLFFQSCQRKKYVCNTWILLLWHARRTSQRYKIEKNWITFFQQLSGDGGDCNSFHLFSIRRWATMFWCRRSLQPADAPNKWAEKKADHLRRGQQALLVFLQKQLSVFFVGRRSIASVQATALISWLAAMNLTANLQSPVYNTEQKV